MFDYQNKFPELTATEAAAILDRVVAIPDRLARLAQGLTTAQLRERPAPDEWSIAETLAHMRASDDIITPRIYVLLASDNPTFPSVDERLLAEQAGYAEMDFQTSLALFRLRRIEMVDMLRRRPLADWDRRGTHTAYGSFNLAYVLSHMAWHEEDHCAQMEHSVSALSHPAVGPTAAEVENLLDRMAAVPGRVAAAVAGWSETQFRARPAPDEWSAAEVLAHLRVADEMLTSRAYLILACDNPPITANDGGRWNAISGYAEQDVPTLLAHYAARRADVVTVLRRATLEDWRRTGVHSMRGTVTLFHQVKFLVDHDREHCEQLEAIQAI